MAGRKRKSEEFEADLQHWSHGDRSRGVVAATTDHVAKEGFATVEEVNDAIDHGTCNEPFAVEEPPPPYSTRPPIVHLADERPRGVEQQRYLSHQPDSARRSPSPQNGYGKYYSESSSIQGPSRPPSRHECRTTPHVLPPGSSSRKRQLSPEGRSAQPLTQSDWPQTRPIADTPSVYQTRVDRANRTEKHIPPARRNQSPIKSTRERTLARRTIDDSEDDEDLVETPGTESEKQAEWGREILQPQSRAAQDSIPGYLPEKAVQREDGSQIERVSAHVKAPPSPEIDMLHPQTSTKTQIMLKPQPSSEVDPPWEEYRTPVQQTPRENKKEEKPSSPLPGVGMTQTTSSRIEIPPDLQHVDTIVLTKDNQPLIAGFAAFTSEDLARHRRKVIEELECTEEDFRDVLDDEDESAVADLGDRIQALRRRRDAFDQMIDVRSELCQITHFRKRLKNEAVAAVENTEAVLALRIRVKAAGETMKTIEAAIIALIESAGLGVKSLAPEQARVAVNSTQAPSKQETSTQMVPDSTCMQTQLVQQTQAPYHDQAMRRSPTKLHSNTYGTSVQKENVRPYDDHTTRLPTHMEDEDDDYGEEADDHDLLAVEQNHQKRAMTYQASSRDVFAERSINRMPEARPANVRTNALPPTKTTKSVEIGPEKDYPWTEAVKSELKHTFKLRGFRPNQLNTINSTLAAKDVFVLMPTGGGKSLCYQLPSRVMTGRTRGVTIVISPLMSLMDDQVSHLKKLNIQAFQLNGDTDAQSRNIIYSSLNERNPQEFVQLLYVTPEMLGKSNALINKLRSLHNRKLLARIVIDEAHCVSQWGHDFRPDYKSLGEICKEFHGVPLMALTATATENVKVDIIHNLRMEDCEIFTQSFNRPNLYYEVRRKKGKENLLDPITEIIKSSYRNQCGIIYCLSRKKCEEVAKALRKESGIRAAHFHAHMEPAEKKNVLSEWQAGRVHVIVATIAFGMGIDKPDVRFVIHHSLPKSLEGYYQETGRAGRDGKPSGCYLFYSFQDCAALKRMIDDGEGNYEQKQRQQNMLRQMIIYCETEDDCRRVQVLHYFNERFRPDDCGGNCDNCNFTGTFEDIDFTDHAAAAISLVEQMQSDEPTILQCVDVFKGSMAKKIKDSGWNELREHGWGADVERNELERLFYRLLSSNAITEVNVAYRNGFTHQYVTIGPRGYEYKRKKASVILKVRTSGGAKVRKPKDAMAKSLKVNQSKSGTSKSRIRQQPESTFVSSPAGERPRIHRRKAPDFDDGPTDDEVDIPHISRHSCRPATKGYRYDGFCLPDARDSDNDQESEDDFEPVRTSTTTHGNPRTKPLGERIEVDEQLVGLSPWHISKVHEFVDEGTTLGKRIMADKKLHRSPFTTTMLRSMVIFFPQDEEELKARLGAAAEKVAHHGAKFMQLIRKYQAIISEGSPRDDPVYDPNKEIIEVHSDNHEAEAFDDTVSSAGGYVPEEASPYFQPNPHVQRMNAQIAQIESQKPQATSRSWSASEELPAGKSKSSWIGKGSSKGGKKKSGQKYPYSKPDAGRVRKRKSSTSKSASRRSNSVPRQNNARATSNATTRPAAGGSQRTMDNTGGIMAMPT